MVNGLPTLHLPDVCTNSPSPGKAFCVNHCQLLEVSAPEVPTGLREFLKYSGVMKNDDLGMYIYICVNLCTIGNVTEIP